jgi:hypothetical protein
MTEQLQLLSKVPASRSTDNAASFRAEERQNKSGKRASDQHKALEAVRRYPGCTSKELAALTGLDRYMLARRLPDLHPVYLDRIDGPDGFRWLPKQTSIYT